MKIAIKCITFILILIIILAVLSKVFEPKNNTQNAGIEEDRLLATGVFAEKENSLDVLVFGDSESFTSFIPLEIWNKYGISSYVCGTPGQKLPLTYRNIKNTLKKQTPKIIMLETNTIYTPIKVSDAIKEKGDNILPAFQFHNRWKSLTLDDLRVQSRYTVRQENKGYYFSDKIKSSISKKYMSHSDNIKKIKRLNRMYVEKIKKYCDKNNIELVLYSAPSTVNWSYDKHNGVEKIAKQLNVDFIDLNTKISELQIDWKQDSRDNGDHLNYFGALKTTAYLGEYLYNKNLLTDHRQDAEYASWNERYENYKNK